LERRARAGDAEAANRVGKYYEMVMNGNKSALSWFDLPITVTLLAFENMRRRTT